MNESDNINFEITENHNQIINWFDGKEPLSGFGKMMLGESLIKKGQIDKGISLIKSGWISADLTRQDLKHFRVDVNL